MKRKSWNPFLMMFIASLILLASGCSNGYSYNEGLKDIESVEAKYLEGSYVAAESINDYLSDMNLLRTRIASKGNTKDVLALIETINFKINSATARRNIIDIRTLSKDGITCDEKADAEQFYTLSKSAAQYTRNAAGNLDKLLSGYKSFLDEDTETLYSQQKSNLDATAKSIESGVLQMKDSLAECK